MIKKYGLFCTLFILLCFFTSWILVSAEAKDGRSSISGTPGFTLLNINNLSTAAGSNGSFPSNNPYRPGNSTIFPKGIASIVFTEGFVWGGILADWGTEEVHVGGSTYRSGLNPGAILGLNTGSAQDPSNPDVRIWRIRPDWEHADLSAEAAEMNYQFSETELRDQYEKDWNEWPAELGAPYIDKDGNNQYDPTDIAGIPGASQTIWLVANDLDESVCRGLYGSTPLGVEIQMTLWAYDRPEGDPFDDISFRRIRLIYKGTGYTTDDARIDQMYISQWADPDIGNYTDDLAGCDSSLELVFAYNGMSEDNDFRDYDLKPPAAGYTLLQGPMVVSPGDTGYAGFQKKAGYRNLGVSSSYFFASGSADSDPNFGVYDGTLQFYNLLLGLRPRPEYPDGLPWISPIDNTPTKFPLSGDPLSGQGWIDGNPYGPGDRRIGLNSGPFTMVLGDTQEVITALVGDLSENDNFARFRHVYGVKRKAGAIKSFLSDGIAVHIIGPHIVKKHEEVMLKAACLFLDPDDHTQSIVWQISYKPSGSGVSLDTYQGESTTFTPDSAGPYKITATVTSVSGKARDADIVVEASDNRPPEITLVLEKREIIWGDSVFVDAGSTTDPDNDNLNFGFESKAFVRPVPGGRGAFIRPFTTGLERFMVSAFDGYFGATRQDSFFVNPLSSPGISIKYSYLDPSWVPLYSPYFLGDTLLTICPNSSDAGIRVYQIGEDTIIFGQKIELTDVVRIYGIRNNMLYIGKRGSGFTGPGPLSIYAVGENWDLTPVLEEYLPDNNEIQSMQFYENEALVQARGYMPYRDYLYKIDFMTNPSAPQIVATKEFSYPTMLQGITILDENYFIARITEYSELVEKINLIITRTNFSEVGSFTIPGNWSNFSLQENRMYVTYSDSVVIYDISSILNPAWLSRIQIDPPASWVSPAGFHSSADEIAENSLYIKTNYGFNIFDISNPMDPVRTNFIYGNNASLIYHTGDFYMVNNSADLDNPYSGINKIDIITGIPAHNHGVPNSYCLFQNFPNPFNPVTRINFTIPSREKVELVVYDILGRKVVDILKEILPPGTHQIEFNGEGMASGLYFYIIRAGDFRDVKKMVLIR